MQRQLRLSLVSLCLVLAAEPIRAQQRPDAGALLQQIEKNLPPPKTPGGKLPQPAPAPAELGAIAGTSVMVTGFRYTGNQLLDARELDRATAPWVGRRADLNELRNAARAVAALYRERGLVVRAFLPKQDVTAGVITIQVEEAVFGGVAWDGAGPRRVSRRLVEDMITQAQPVGQTLRTADLERGLLLADDLPGVTVAGHMVTGEVAGQTGILVKASDEPVLSGDLFLDNSGSESTGHMRSGLTAALNSPFGIGEQFSSYLIHSRGSDYARLAASLPVSPGGLRLGASASTMHYRLVQQEFQALDAKGNSNTLGLDASYPIWRGRARNLYLLGNLDRRAFDNEANGATTSHYVVESLSLGLNANASDELGGIGASQGSLTWSSGRVRLAAGSVARIDHSERSFDVWRYNLERQQSLGNTLSAYLAWRGQLAKHNLDSSEYFFLGGPRAARAYAGSEAGGASGSLLTFELRQRLFGNVTLSAFYDYGRITRYRQLDSTLGIPLAMPAQNRYHLSDAGLGLSWLMPNNIALNANWARALGANPAGLADKHRINFSLSVPFALGAPAAP